MPISNKLTNIKKLSSKKAQNQVEKLTKVINMKVVKTSANNTRYGNSLAKKKRSMSRYKDGSIKLGS